MRKFLISLTRNPISLVGSAIAVASAILIVTLFTIEIFGFIGNPYVGILAYLILPGIFLLGLILIPIGIHQERKRARLAQAAGERAPGFPVIDLNREATRRWVMIFAVVSAINIVILATATYKGVEVMESTEFCGTTCHTVMQPEHTAYQRSPHSRVRCVECHIGPGADWFVKSKLSGAWQVVSVAFDLYPKPIPTPVHDLRPARETCEQCHWPDKFVGDRLKVITHHEDDEVNTETKTVLLLRVGGVQGAQSHGIHWHVDPRIQIRYRSDPTREIIHEVELTDEEGNVKTYYAPDARANGDVAEGEEVEASEWRVMDCVDCHNRPTHVYFLPDQEVDLALMKGFISKSLPFVRREAINALKGEYASHEEAREGIAATLGAYYRESYPDLDAEMEALVQQAGRQLGEIYATNVFPEMNVTWGTYPNHIGHERFDGCFRCHDDAHATEDGETISQDCFTCHALLAIEEEDPEILAQFE